MMRSVCSNLHYGGHALGVFGRAGFLTSRSVMAKSSGLENTVVFSGSGSDKLAGSMLEGNSYLRGSKALEAELKNLENRGSDDPFTPGLRKLQKRAGFYKQVEAEKLISRCAATTAS